MGVFWITISYQYGKGKSGLIKALDNGAFSVGPDYPTAQAFAMLNHGHTCFMRKMDATLPDYIKNKIAGLIR